MASALHIVSFTRGDHICLFYRDLKDQLSTAVPFIAIGLRRNERCFCVLPKPVHSSLLEALSDDEINTRKEIERGALLLTTPEETYLQDGGFDRARMTKLLEAKVKEALAHGFQGFRAAGDLSWAAQDTSCCAQLPEYEIMMSEFYPQRPALGLCMYDVRLFDPNQLRELMQIHQSAVSSPDDVKRAIRIRNGTAFGDIIFDRSSPSVFHYTVQEDDSPKVLATGQEPSLPHAFASVRYFLSNR